MERIRPRASELNDVTDETLMAWPPAATAVRGKAPSVGTAQDDARDAPPQPSPPPRPLLGGIRERDTQAGAPSDAPKVSTKPLSAFRRARLQRTGAPKPPTRDALAMPPPPDPTRDPGGGAAPETVSSLLADIAQDNERKIAHMSYDHVEEELRDAEAFFGKDLLAKLSQRRARTAGWPAMERLDLHDTPPPAPPPAREPLSDARADLEALRQTYFPDEPETVPPPLAWTVDTPDAPFSAQVRFGFDGHVVSRPNDVFSEAPDATYLAGLHHHGHDPTAPGYTLDEILHWTRSNVASQRCIALQLMQRIAAAHPLASASENEAHRVLDADHRAMRARFLFTARYLLDDRHRSVSRAAAECLASCIQSVRHISTDAFLVAESPIAADPDMDGTVSVADPLDLHAPPPSFHAPDASHLELLQHNWVDGLLATHILDALETHLSDTDAPTRPVCDALCGLALHRSDATQAIAARPRLVHVLVAHAATQAPWPLTSRPWPLVDAMLALLRIVQVSSTCASMLVAQGALDPVLRYIVLPPQDLHSQPPDDLAAHEHALASTALRLFAALGRYRVNSASVREVHAALPTWAHWAARVWPQLGADDVRLASIHALFDLLAVWTRAAIEGPKHGDLGANGPAVHDWAAFSIALLAERGPRSSRALSAQGRAAAHLATWCELVRALPTEMERPAVHTAAEAVLAQWSPAKELSLYAPQISAAADAQTALRAAVDVSRHASAWHDFLALAHAASHAQLAAHAQRQLLALLRLPLRELCSRVRAADSLITAHRTWIVASCVDAEGPEAALRLLHALGPEESALAAQILPRIAAQVDARAWDILSPFLLDNVRVASSTPSLVTSVRGEAPLTTLQVRRVAPPAVDTDPRTGAELWQSRAAGLPLRADWPMLALDDLLHSGDAHVFNARDVLPAAWDFSEADVVQASLDLTLYVAEQRVVPSAYLWFGMMKVFLLELAPPAHPAATGDVTGRDLFASPPMAARLERLMAVADAPDQDHTLLVRDAAAHLLPRSMPLYQMYTDLLGLYESISMNDPLFARVLLPPLAMAYEADYRRLLWREYAMMLPGIQVPLEHVPRVHGQRLEAYLWPCEADKDVLLAYAHALAQGRVSPTQPFLYAVALHHVSAALWHDEGGWGEVRVLPAVQASLARTVLPAPGLYARPRR
ncbi:hypothetical protein MCAP1_000563 [Malassezia caprae]|uniref:RNA polymerase II-associated protein 1 n=1 Tax=Malassezia caprae TaxID=1381934 RepID=A0AAF0E7V2_9BASI|nr:hypothetical protein MCAP1_000563 [Malassezia caprae]